MAVKIDFRQIYFDESQKEELFPFAKPFFNRNLTPYFENTVISDLVKQSEAEKISVCSWALKRKLELRVPPRTELTEEVLYSDYDILSFNKSSKTHDMMIALEVWHPGSKVILSEICKEIGFPMPEKIKWPIYQNAFIARADVYKDYVVNFLDPAMEAMEETQRIRNMLFVDSHYKYTILNQPVDYKNIKEKLGLPFVPMHPFILERCFSIYLQKKNLNVVYL
jgi:hypothetical protein